MAYKAASIDKLDTTENLKDYFFSEKIDGWQAFLKKKGKLISKSGKIEFGTPFSLPNPKFKLAGELKIPKKQAPAVASLRNADAPGWKTAKYFVFDAPSAKPFEKRIENAKREVSRICKKMKKTKKKCFLQTLEHKKVKNKKQLKKVLRKIVENGGEGLVLTKKTSKYDTSGKRTNERVKVKPRNDMEGVIESHVFKKDGNLKSVVLGPYGRHKFAKFQLSSGFTKRMKDNFSRELKIGSVIKFSYRGLTDDKKPKEAAFLHFRNDL